MKKEKEKKSHMRTGNIVSVQLKSFSLGRIRMKIFTLALALAPDSALYTVVFSYTNVFIWSVFTRI